jgi:hypothetical protein
MLGSRVFERYIPGMSDVPFKVEVDPATPGSADYVAAAEAILRDHFDQHPLPTAAAEATSESATLDEELTPENVLAHLVWQRSHPEHVEFRGLSEPWTLVITLSLAPFLAGFLGEGGKRLFNKLLHLRGGAEPTPVIIRDADTGTEVYVQSRLKQELSDQAWRELVKIALPKPPKSQWKFTRRAIVWNDMASFAANAGVSFGINEAGGQISGEALFAVEDDAGESGHDQWVLDLDIEVTAEANSQEDAPSGRRWFRRPPKPKNEPEAKDEPKILTLKFKWRAQKRRWVLPR